MTRYSEIGKLFDRLPPHSLESEMSLLGCIIVGADDNVMDDLPPIRPSDFYSPAHGAIFKALATVHRNREAIDLVALQDQLKRTGALDDVGGDDYLVRLAEGTPSWANWPHYCRKVVGYARLRRLIDAAGQTLYDCFNVANFDGDAIAEVMAEAERRITDLADTNPIHEPLPLGPIIVAEIDRELAGKPIPGVPTGFAGIDGILGGIRPGELAILAARPSVGKSALALNIAENIANRGTCVGFFSAEMSAESLARRVVASDEHGRERRETLARLRDELADIPIIVDETPSIDVSVLRSRARSMVRRRGVKCIVVDYLQLLSPPERESEQAEISATSRSIKAMAGELKIPVLCVAQLNRQVESREGGRPRLSDLRGSGSIEQDADTVMFIHREAYGKTRDWMLDPKNYNLLTLAELIVAKQRNGPTGTALLRWDERCTRFFDDARKGETGWPV